MPFPLDHYIEASHVDYKERLEEKKPRSWLKSVSAFANTECLEKIISDSAAGSFSGEVRKKRMETS